MGKVFIVAWKEFLATVATKGFIFGMLFPPFIMTLMIVMMPILMNKKAPTVYGHVAVIDPSGLVAPRIQDAFSAEKIKERKDKKLREVMEAGSKAMGIDPDAAKQMKEQADSNPMAAANALIPETNLTVTVLPPTTSIEEARKEILKATGREQSAEGTSARLALMFIPEETVRTSELDAEGRPNFEAYQLLTAPLLDIEVQQDIRDQTNRAIVDARLADAGQNPEKIRGLTAWPKVEEKSVTKEGDRSTNKVAKMMIPGAFMFLLWISTFTAGQYLLTSTIEEKSSRVMEVILSAVSPMQLMLGKILGKGAVGLLILLLYSSAGISAMIFFAYAHLLAWQNLIYLFVFFMIAYMVIACLMASIGSAVNDINEAQSLMGPVMMVLIIPMMLWMPILRNPNSMFAQVCSFVPLINPFVMVLRISGSEPIPTWQIPASILVGLLTVAFMCWAAAKIFRIGVLMYGKPPNFATLVKWVRMA
ncbi:MAG: ABC transporter permease [Phycisphaeraceae bacterium]|nr:ABC transporter permease [Phycisphaeraceae bacterium]